MADASIVRCGWICVCLDEFGDCASTAAGIVCHTSYSGATATFDGAGKPGEWTSEARDYANTRYSPLTQINASNVGTLKLAWSFSDGSQYGHEGAPLVVGDTMYLVTPYPEHRLRARSHQAQSVDQMVVRTQPSPAAIGKGLL